MSSTLELPSTVDEFLADHSAMILHVVKRYAKTPDERDDYRQAAVVALWEQWAERPSDPAMGKKWIWRIINNAAGAAQRADRQAAQMRWHCENADDAWGFESIAVDDSSDSGEQCAEGEMIRHLQEIMPQLPEKLLRVVRRYYGLDARPAAETIRQTAFDLGLTTSVVSQHLRSAHEFLESALCPR